MKKTIVVVICILLAIVLLIPIPRYQDDGGTVGYYAVLYSVEKVHRITPDVNSRERILKEPL